MNPKLAPPIPSICARDRPPGRRGSRLRTQPERSCKLPVGQIQPQKTGPCSRVTAMITMGKASQ
jgi:hypothetical protein